jgi:type IV pilus assembly protein PilB
MADNVIPAVNAQRLALQGLPLRLIQDGLLDEKSMQVAMAAAKDANTNLVSHLVANNLANAREIAIAASQEFGVPLLDLDAIQPDIDTVKLVSDKLLAKHRVLPLVKRGKRLFVAVSDPTNLHALDEIKFQTGLSIEAVVVEEDKLQRISTKAIEQVDTQMPALTDDDLDLENLDVSPGDEDLEKDTVGRDDVEDAPIVRFVNKVLLDAIKKGASDIHFEPYEKTYRIRLRLDGYLKEIANPPVQLAVKLAARPRTGASRCASPRTARSTSASAPARRCSARRSWRVFSTRRARCSASKRSATSRCRRISTCRRFRSRTA